MDCHSLSVGMWGDWWSSAYPSTSVLIKADMLVIQDLSEPLPSQKELRWVLRSGVDEVQVGQSNPIPINWMQLLLLCPWPQLSPERFDVNNSASAWNDSCLRLYPELHSTLNVAPDSCVTSAAMLTWLLMNGNGHFLIMNVCSRLLRYFLSQWVSIVSQ